MWEGESWARDVDINHQCYISSCRTTKTRLFTVYILLQRSDNPATLLSAEPQYSYTYYCRVQAIFMKLQQQILPALIKLLDDLNVFRIFTNFSTQELSNLLTGDTHKIFVHIPNIRDRGRRYPLKILTPLVLISLSIPAQTCPSKMWNGLY